MQRLLYHLARYSPGYLNRERIETPHIPSYSEGDEYSPGYLNRERIETRLIQCGIVVLMDSPGYLNRERIETFLHCNSRPVQLILPVI